MRLLSRRRDNPKTPRRKSIAFYSPDYHTTFFYKAELERLGWKVRIFVPPGYPKDLLYDANQVTTISRSEPLPKWFPNFITRITDQIRFGMRVAPVLWSKYIFFYGKPPLFSFEKNPQFRRIATFVFGEGFVLSLALPALLGSKVLCVPSGCHDESTQETFLTFDDGQVCGNCGYFDRCDDERNKLNLAAIERFSSYNICTDPFESESPRFNLIRWKTIDLGLWSPDLVAPDHLRLPKNNSLVVLHSVSLQGRTFGGRNIKGSRFVSAAVDQLQKDGFDLTLYSPSGVPSNQMRYVQCQADIVVDQLIYGWWGSTSVESMALGKPVVCYLRESWKERFFETFPDIDTLPIIEANPSTIHDVLRQLAEDPELRKQKGLESRAFAEQHFSPLKNAISLHETLMRL